VYKPGLTYFPAVSITPDNKGKLIATVCKGHGSGDFVQLGEADGFLELPAEGAEFSPDAAYPFHPIRNRFL
jgi:molybdopterin molybdotransferase